MLLIPCPVCGPRPELEFVYGGEAHIRRAASDEALTEAELADFLYHRSNTRGLHEERWRHLHGCGRFFDTVRHTVTDQFQAGTGIGETYSGVDAPP